MRTDEEKRLCSEIEERLMQLLRLKYPYYEQAIIVDALIIGATQWVNSDGEMESGITGVPLSEDMPPYRVKGLLVDMRDMTLLDEMGDVEGDS